MTTDDKSDDDATRRDRIDAGDPASWREEFLAAAGQVLDPDRVSRLRAYSDNPGRIADAAVAAHLEDERMVQQMRFHRERREAGRALALGDKDALESHRGRVASAGAELGLLRLQRDVANGTLEIQRDEVPPKARRSQSKSSTD